jgi:alpha-galactosidase
MAELENELLRLVCNEEDGSFDIYDKVLDIKVISCAYSSVHLVSPEGNEVILSSLEALHKEYEIIPLADRFGDGQALIARFTYSLGFVFTLKIHRYDDHPFLLFQCSIQASEMGYRLHALLPLRLSQQTGGDLELGQLLDLRMFRQDWQSWSPVSVIPLTEPLKRPWMKLPRLIMYSTEEKLGKGEYLSDNLLVMKNVETQQFLLLGFISMKTQITQIGIHVNIKKHLSQKLFARSTIGGVRLEPDVEVSSEKLVLILNGMDTLQSLDYYAALAQKEMQALSWDHIPVGWCTWYYYYWHRVTQDAILNHSKLLASRRDLPIEVVQLDDGYLPKRRSNVNIGDWFDTNDRFPEGLKYVADQITKDGHQPGLWLAPFLISRSSKLYQQHPDWVIKDRDGNPMEAQINPEWGTFNKFYGLDCTHPAAQEWLRRLFKTIIDDWGYRFIKIDFIFAAALAGVFHDPSMTRVQAYRKGLEIIREAVGEEVFILGCGAPLGPSIGLVNGMRIGGDTYYGFNQPFLYWFLNKFFFAGLEGVPSMKEALKAVILRSFMNHKFWINDPDCLLVRQTRSNLKAHEIQFEVTLLGLCGGLLLSSDNLFELTPDDIELIKFLIPPSTDRVLPLDLFESNPPTVLKLEISPERFFNPYSLVGIFNWTKKTQEVSVSASQFQLDVKGTYHVFDYWQRRYFQIHGDETHITELKRNSAKLFVVRPAKEVPQLIASTFHFKQGKEDVTNFTFNAQTNTLRIAVTRPGSNSGALYICLPPAFQEKELIAESSCSMERTDDGLLLIELAFEEKTELKLQLEK